MPAEQSNKGMKRYTIPICTGCGGILTGLGEPACTCDRAHTKTGKLVEVHALNSPPLEERQRYQVVTDQGLVVHPDEADEMGLEEVREIAEDYAQTPNVTGVRAQTCFVSTSPWTDLPGEEER
jgi:hypothetical protein